MRSLSVCASACLRSGYQSISPRGRKGFMGSAMVTLWTLASIPTILHNQNILDWFTFPLHTLSSSTLPLQKIRRQGASCSPLEPLASWLTSTVCVYIGHFCVVWVSRRVLWPPFPPLNLFLSPKLLRPCGSSQFTASAQSYLLFFDHRSFWALRGESGCTTAFKRQPS
jgi:hypothetical protein